MVRTRTKHPAHLDGHYGGDTPKPELLFIPDVRREAVAPACCEPHYVGGPTDHTRHRWLKRTRAMWAELWASPISNLYSGSDAHPLYMLADLWDEAERARRIYEAQRVVEGSEGQPRMHPALDAMMKATREIRALEAQFGIGPLSRLRLGVELGGALIPPDGDPEDEPEEISEYRGPEPPPGVEVIPPEGPAA